MLRTVEIELTDSELISKIKKKDKNAFECLYRKYVGFALRTATLAMNNNRSLAADSVQETFIRVYKHIDQFNMDKPFKPWLYTILINECNRLLLKQSIVMSSEEIMDNPTLARTDPYHFEQYEELYEGIHCLEDINKIPIVLKYLNGFSENEISMMLKLNLNTVKSRLYKGRQKLKLLLGNETTREV